MRDQLPSVRRLLAMLLLVCFGISVPMAALPMRVCQLEGKLLSPGFVTFGETATHKDKCCPDCGETESGDSCCHDVKKLPASPEPSGPLVLPPLFFCEANPRVVLPPCPVAEVDASFALSRPIRGPIPPGLRRALLGIWNI